MLFGSELKEQNKQTKQKTKPTRNFPSTHPISEWTFQTSFALSGEA